MYTQKADWMNDYSADLGYYVSDHDSYRDSLGLPESAKVSLRFFGNVQIDYRFILVINAPKYLWENCINQTVKKHLLSLKYFVKQKVPIIFFSNDQPDDFLIIEINEIDQINKNKDLRLFFEEINPRLLSNSGNAKPKNKSHNDSFQEWTTTNLSQYLTINDIDAFKLSPQNNTLNILELKRPKESYETWLPYTNDAGNYKALDHISHKLKNTHCRTIAYNKDNKDKIVFLNILNIQRDLLSGELYRGSVENIDFNKLVCLQNMQTFDSTKKIRNYK